MSYDIYPNVDKDYFERLFDEIKEIRVSARKSYQKNNEYISTAMYYSVNAPLQGHSLYMFKIIYVLSYGIYEDGRGYGTDEGRSVQNSNL